MLIDGERVREFLTVMIRLEEFHNGVGRIQYPCTPSSPRKKKTQTFYFSIEISDILYPHIFSLLLLWKYKAHLCLSVPLAIFMCPLVSHSSR